LDHGYKLFNEGSIVIERTQKLEEISNDLEVVWHNFASLCEFDAENEN
jgi:hypothetical protein